MGIRCRLSFNVRQNHFLYFINPLEHFDCEVYQVSIHGFGVCVHTQLCVCVCVCMHTCSFSWLREQGCDT
jgi:hypothetical protein